MEELKRIMERAILSRKGSAMGKITQKKIIKKKKNGERRKKRAERGLEKRTG